MTTDIGSYSESVFESIKHISNNGQECWFARELAKVFDYQDFRNFELVIYKAMEACENSALIVADHFGELTEMVEIGSGAHRAFNSYLLSRYACYLIVQNADPSKEIVALGQTYFAIQTRNQEIQEQFSQLSEDEKRLLIRDDMRQHNKQLVDAAKDAGVESTLDYAIFQDEGYKGLYGGLTAKGIHSRKRLRKSQKILDHMGSEELAANLFRATQTESKLRREKIVGKMRANRAHYEVGTKVRQTISDLGGTMPENLPTPEKSIGQLEREQKRIDKGHDREE